MKNKDKFLNWFSIFSMLMVFAMDNAIAVDNSTIVKVEIDHITDRNLAYDICPKVCAKERRHWVYGYDDIVEVHGSTKVTKSRCFCSKDQFPVVEDNASGETMEVIVDGLTGNIVDQRGQEDAFCKEKAESKKLVVGGDYKHVYEKVKCPAVCEIKQRKWTGKWEVKFNTPGEAPCKEGSNGQWIMSSLDLVCTCKK